MSPGSSFGCMYPKSAKMPSHACLISGSNASRMARKRTRQAALIAPRMSVGLLTV
jgi:hypothetical protein